MSPFISICIPAYKNTEFLKVLLESIAQQTYTNFEVVVSDDSADNDVEQLCNKFTTKYALVYYKNIPAKGSPANWNHAINLAKGKWIKMMHDDDWFVAKDSLQKFAEAAEQQPEAQLIFSGFVKIENNYVVGENILSDSKVKRIQTMPLMLFRNNDIGHPSTTLVKNDTGLKYDEHLKWLVDIEYYIRCLQGKRLYYIPSALVNIGLNEQQITKTAFRNIAIELPESIYVLNKFGVQILNNILVFDNYWRLFRNLNIRKLEDVFDYVEEGLVPNEILKMLNFQLKIPMSILRIGAFSKFFMMIAFFRK